MDVINIIQNNYLYTLIVGASVGIFVTWLTQQILNKRGLFTYTVSHTSIGRSQDDAVFGKIEMTWDMQPVSNLYLSTIELKNESMNDYENIIIQAFTNDTNLLSEQTDIIDSPNILNYSAAYSKELFVSADSSFTDAQLSTYNRKREYDIPVFNRRQVVRLSYLNSAHTSEAPSIWLDVSQKGVKLKYQPPQNELFGVSQAKAALIGLLQGTLFIIVLVSYTQNNWVIAIGAFLFGLLAQVPGALTIKGYRKLRDFIGG